MKIIEGTPKEIREYELEQSKKVPATNFAQAVREIIGEKSEKDSPAVEWHWSRTKHLWIRISEMNEFYILNIIKRMFADFPSKNLVDDDEFKTLIHRLNTLLNK